MKFEFNKETDVLFEAILSLKDKKECELFFRDLCTISELKSMSERFLVVQKVMDKIPYRKIAEETGVSTATITRVAHWFENGEGGYRMALKRIKK